MTDTEVAEIIQKTSCGGFSRYEKLAGGAVGIP